MLVILAWLVPGLLAGRPFAGLTKLLFDIGIGIAAFEDFGLTPFPMQRIQQWQPRWWRLKMLFHNPSLTRLGERYQCSSFVKLSQRSEVERPCASVAESAAISR